MQSKLCVPDLLATKVLSWWHKLETLHSHGRKHSNSVKYRLFGSHLASHCIKIALGVRTVSFCVPARHFMGICDPILFPRASLIV